MSVCVGLPAYQSDRRPHFLGGFLNSTDMFLWFILLDRFCRSETFLNFHYRQSQTIVLFVLIKLEFDDFTTNYTVC